MVYPFDKYITLFLQSSVSTFTRIEGVRKSNIIYQSFFVKHVYIIRPLKSDIFFFDYICTWPGYNYQIYITSINLLFFTNKVFHKTYSNDQAVITFVFIIYMFWYTQKITDYNLFSMFLTETKVKQLFVSFVVIFQ